MSMQDILYAFPSAAYLFVLVLPLAWSYWQLYNYRKNIISHFTSSNILQELLIPRAFFLYFTKVILLCCAWCCLVFALMQPIGYGYYPAEMRTPQLSDHKQSSGQSVVKKRKLHEIILLVDASASMGVKDTRTEVSRLDFAKEIADHIVRQLRGQQVSLNAFTSEVTPLAPLTTDYFFVRLALKQVGINEGGYAGTDIGKALQDIRKNYFPLETPITKTLILLTDGEDTVLEGQQGLAYENSVKKIIDLVSDAEKNHLQVFAIGLGTKTGAPIPGLTFEGKPVTSSLHEELLKKLGKSGSYYYANDFAAINLAAEILQVINADRQEKEQTQSNFALGQDFLVHKHYYQYPLGIAIALLIAMLWLPDRRTAISRIGAS